MHKPIVSINSQTMPKHYQSQRNSVYIRGIRCIECIRIYIHAYSWCKRPNVDEDNVFPYYFPWSSLVCVGLAADQLRQAMLDLVTCLLDVPCAQFLGDSILRRECSSEESTSSLDLVAIASFGSLKIPICLDDSFAGNPRRNNLFRHGWLENPHEWRLIAGKICEFHGPFSSIVQLAMLDSRRVFQMLHDSLIFQDSKIYHRWHAKLQIPNPFFDFFGCG